MTPNTAARCTFLIATCLLVAPAGNAQSAGFESGVRTVPFVTDGVVSIGARNGQQTTIELAADEEIQTVAVGDVAAWAVNVDKARSRIYVKPAQGGAETNMTVVTNARRYIFALGQGEGAPYVLRFRYGAREVAPPLDPGAIVGRYLLSGTKALRPATMYDDGIHTFVEWPSDVALPAVFSIDRLGRESVVNGAMRGALYVLDSVSDRLVFRIDTYVAHATRTLPKTRRTR
jgi:type IV secretion system protein VirB9